MKKQTLILFTRVDEQAFDDELKTLSPNIVFVDNVGSRDPYVERSGIAECRSRTIGILNKDIYPRGVDRGVYLVFMNKSSSLDPTSVVPEEEILASGDISIAMDEGCVESDQMKPFVKHVWGALKKISTKRIHVVSLETGEVINSKPSNIVAGHDAVRWCREKSDRYCKARSVQVYLRPSD